MPRYYVGGGTGERASTITQKEVGGVWVPRQQGQRDAKRPRSGGKREKKVRKHYRVNKKNKVRKG